MTEWMSRLFKGLIFLTAIIAFSAIICVVVITLGDIFLRFISRAAVPFTGQPLTWAVPGVIDLSQLLVVIAASLAIPVAFMHGAHVTIDLLEPMMSRRVRQLAALISTALSFSLIGGCVWFGWDEMLSQQEMNTTSATLNIPYVYYLAPLLYGLAVSLIAILVSLLSGRALHTRDSGAPHA